MDVIYLPKTVLIRRVKELFLLSLITLTVAIFLILLIERVFPSEFESVKTIEANEKPKLIRGGDGKAKEIGGFKKTITDNKVRIQNRVNQNLKKVRNASPRVVVVAISVAMMTALTTLETRRAVVEFARLLDGLYRRGGLKKGLPTLLQVTYEKYMLVVAPDPTRLLTENFQFTLKETLQIVVFYLKYSAEFRAKLLQYAVFSFSGGIMALFIITPVLHWTFILILLALKSNSSYPTPPALIKELTGGAIEPPIIQIERIEKANSTLKNIIDRIIDFPPKMEDPKIEDFPSIIKDPRIIDFPPIIEDPKMEDFPSIIEDPKIIDFPPIIEDPKTEDFPSIIKDPRIIDFDTEIKNFEIIGEKPIIPEPGGEDFPSIIQDPEDEDFPFEIKLIEMNLDELEMDVEN